MPDDCAASVVVALLSELVAAQRENTAELRRLCADLRRRDKLAAPKLVAALTEYFGAGSRFTVAGLFGIAADEPHGAIADALAELVDMNASAHSRATALGALLSRLPEVEIVARQRGVAVYRLRTSAE